MKRPLEPNPIVLVDGNPLPTNIKFFNELLNFLRYNGLVSGRNSIERVDFCGLVQIHDQLFLFLPKTLDPHLSQQTLSQFKLLLRVLRKYSRSESEEIAESKGGLIGEHATFDLAWNILEDWGRYGFYRPEQKQILLYNQGKINWSRTIRSVGPIYSNEGPIYTEFYRNMSEQHHENFIRKLHRYVVTRCYNQFGWLQSGSIPELSDSDALEFKYKKQFAIAQLKIERGKTSSDRNMRLFDLIEVFIRTEGMKSNEIKAAFGLNSFWRVWEKMCAEILGNDLRSIASILPQPEYRTPDKRFTNTAFGAIETRTTQRPDIVLVSSDIVAVLDAKYYDTNHSMPSWPDLVKQFLYANTLKTVFNDKKILNILIFPGKREVVPEALTSAPFAALYSDGKMLNVLGHVFCLCCDLEDFMRKYVHGISGFELKERLLELGRSHQTGDDKLKETHPVEMLKTKIR